MNTKGDLTDFIYAALFAALTAVLGFVSIPFCSANGGIGICFYTIAFQSSSCFRTEFGNNAGGKYSNGEASSI
ncbi:MAG: hypothetical protein H6Q71_2428 [Firmicutes bacterium]|nr:hypothetical protein [Bacillota bacterium]